MEANLENSAVTTGLEKSVFILISKKSESHSLLCWRLLRIPRTARRSNQSILKEINPEYSLEELMLKLTFQFLAI